MSRVKDHIRRNGIIRAVHRVVEDESELPQGATFCGAWYLTSRTSHEYDDFLVRVYRVADRGYYAVDHYMLQH